LFVPFHLPYMRETIYIVYRKSNMTGEGRISSTSPEHEVSHVYHRAGLNSRCRWRVVPRGHAPLLLPRCFPSRPRCRPFPRRRASPALQASHRATGQPPVPPASHPRRRAAARSRRPAVQPPAPGPPPCPRAAPALGVRARWRTGAGGASALGITRE
jgi:hypothetical protein